MLVILCESEFYADQSEGGAVLEGDMSVVVIILAKYDHTRYELRDVITLCTDLLRWDLAPVGEGGCESLGTWVEIEGEGYEGPWSGYTEMTQGN